IILNLIFVNDDIQILNLVKKYI
ncbi:hypothetical protein Q604_UNBC09850G0001, partial [human gut metagenome]